MQPAPKKKVFISHVEEDGATAREIAASLEGKGYSAWYYERDCPLGADYFEETYKAVSFCEALILLISPRSVESDQITREIVRAAETCKAFLPLLLDIPYEDYRQRRPGWKQAMGAANSLRIPPGGTPAILSALVDGLKAKGIQPDGAAGKTATAGAVAMPAKTASTVVSSTPQASPVAAGTKVVILYKRDAHPDEELLNMLESQLPTQGHTVFIDRHMHAGVQWLLELETQIRGAHAVIPLLSAESAGSDMLSWEVETAHEAAQQQNGKPYLIPVRVNFEGPLPAGSLANILNPIQYVVWKGTNDDSRLVSELAASLRNPPTPRVRRFERAGGAVPLDSEFYVVRDTDEQFREAIERLDGIVLVKGPRQMGKTSLLSRGLQQAREAGARVVTTDFQMLDAADLASLTTLFRTLAEMLAEQLDLDYSREQVWRLDRPAKLSFRGFLKDIVLANMSVPLVWGMDEVDRLFNCEFATEAFGFFRSWFNARALDPQGPWKNLTIVIAHATEPHLFIKNPFESPFNVGTRLELRDFTLEQVAELNRRYDGPLKDADELKRFYQLVGGNPYLVRRGLEELKVKNIGVAELEATADRDDGPFEDHLNRIMVVLAKNTALRETVRQILEGKSGIPLDDFIRLKTAGIMVGDSSQPRTRCQIYDTFLRRRLCATQAAH